MTERGKRHVARSASTFSIGPSSVTHEGDSIVVRVDERQTPLPFRLTGTVRLTPISVQPGTFALDPAGRHRWRPIAPLARIEVELTHPALRWSGHGYLDTNAGDEPLEAGFTRWDWSRRTAGGATELLYDAELRDGSETMLALRVGADGIAERFEPPPRQTVAPTLWRIKGTTRADAPLAKGAIRTVEDTPFYSRSVIRDATGATVGVHESADMDRFASRIVQGMLPFRMPRRS
jgi:carotenoid 1,2-hydratase